MNLPADVSDMRVYYGVDGDKVLNTAVGQIISPTNKPITFATSQLAAQISAATLNISLSSVDSFPATNGRAVIEDNTPNREVIFYSTASS